MNQKILIVFTLFLLISILLLLLMADAKEKSRRTRVLVIVLENPDNTEQRKDIKAFLDKMSAESQLLFTMAGEPGEWNERTAAAYAIVLQIQIDTLTDEKNEIISNAHDPNTLQLLIRSSAALCDDPEFLKQVADTIVRIASH